MTSYHDEHENLSVSTSSIGISERLTEAAARMKAYADAPTVIYAVPGAADRLAVKRDDVLMAQYRLSEAADEIDRLREALKPFAACIDRLAPGEDIAHWRLTDALNHGLTVAHIIAAKDALSHEGNALSNPKGDRHG